MDKTWYREITDDDGHRYIIPVDKTDDWYEWLGGVEDDPEPPEWATPVDGGSAQFTEWRIG